MNYTRTIAFATVFESYDGWMAYLVRVHVSMVDVDDADNHGRMFAAAGADVEADAADASDAAAAAASAAAAKMQSGRRLCSRFQLIIRI